MKQLSMIYAATKHGVIGNSVTNSMPWPRIKRDMHFFKETTSGGTVIMGRKTFESLGKPLPNRQNIVITRQNLQLEGCDVVSSIEEALERATHENVFIIGGAEIYKLALPLVDKLYCTTIKHNYPGDVLMPELPGYWLAHQLHEDDQILIEELDRVY